MQDTVCAENRKQGRKQTDIETDRRIAPAAEVVSKGVEDEITGTALRERSKNNNDNHKEEYMAYSSKRLKNIENPT